MRGGKSSGKIGQEMTLWQTQPKQEHYLLERKEKGNETGKGMHGLFCSKKRGIAERKD